MDSMFITSLEVLYGGDFPLFVWRSPDFPPDICYLRLFCFFLTSIAFYIYRLRDTVAQFHLRFVSRHNADHRANGEATAHSNQAFGAFWSRATPLELLYIWLLSFDELRLAMNVHLPVVRPLMCYARRGATPMHQKNSWHQSRYLLVGLNLMTL